MVSNLSVHGSIHVFHVSIRQFHGLLPFPFAGTQRNLQPAIGQMSPGQTWDELSETIPPSCGVDILVSFPVSAPPFGEWLRMSPDRRYGHRRHRCHRGRRGCHRGHGGRPGRLLFQGLRAFSHWNIVLLGLSKELGAWEMLDVGK